MPLRLRRSLSALFESVASSSTAGPSHSNGHGNGNGHSTNNNGHTDSHSTHSDDPMNEDNDDDEDESTLLAVQPGFNRLLLVLRDERVMRFVKYVSAAAEGSRWDVCGEYEVGIIQEDGEDEEEGSS